MSPTTPTTISASSLAKHLASCNKSSRDKAVRLLKTYLPSQTPQTLTSDQLKKIWKGLFYCIWHADKSQYQLQLINTLSSLLLTLSTDKDGLQLCINYFQVFVITIRREWSGIDYLRLDKFYLLFRRFLHCLFLVFQGKGWDVLVVERFMGVLEERTLFSVDGFAAQGVNYHLAETFLEELRVFLPVKGEVVQVLIQPFLMVLGKSLDKVLLGKIRVGLFGRLLDAGSKLLERKKVGSEEGGNDDEVEVFGAIALTLGFSSKFFELGRSQDCVQGNRKVLFGLHEDFDKLEKDLANSGIDISIPQVKNDLVHIEQVQVANGSDHKRSKKSKKLKKASMEISTEQVQGKQQIASGSVDKLSKKIKKSKKESGGSEMKKSKKNRGLSSNSVVLECENGNMSNGEKPTNDGGVINFNESVISNLQMQFEKIAAEVGMDTDGAGSFDSPATPIMCSVPKKRKRAKSIDGQCSLTNGLFGESVLEGSAVGKSGEKSAKKVRFSMKNNLVWKPHSPLPPQSLRVPPSATPRGSALKKGIPAGPVIETPSTKKIKRMTGSLKKGRKGMKSPIKRLKKLRSHSA